MWPWHSLRWHFKRFSSFLHQRIITWIYYFYPSIGEVSKVTVNWDESCGYIVWHKDKCTLGFPSSMQNCWFSVKCKRKCIHLSAKRSESKNVSKCKVASSSPSFYFTELQYLQFSFLWNKRGRCPSSLLMLLSVSTEREVVRTILSHEKFTPVCLSRIQDLCGRVSIFIVSVLHWRTESKMFKWSESNENKSGTVITATVKLCGRAARVFL